jgi:hypothetical protein
VSSLSLGPEVQGFRALVFLIGATNQAAAQTQKTSSLRQHPCTQANGTTAPRLKAPDPARRLSWKSLQWLLIPPPGAEMAVSCGSRHPDPGLLDLSPRISASLSDNILATLPLHPLVFLSRCSYSPCLFVCVCACSSFKVSTSANSTHDRSNKVLAASRSVSSPSLFVLRLSTKTLSQNTRAFRVLLFHSFLG